MVKLFFLPFLPLCIHTSILNVAYIDIIIRILMMVTLVHTHIFLSSFLSPSLFLFLSPQISLSSQPPEEEGPRNLLKKKVGLSLSLSPENTDFPFFFWYSESRFDSDFVFRCFPISSFSLDFVFSIFVFRFPDFPVFRFSDFIFSHFVFQFSRFPIPISTFYFSFFLIFPIFRFLFFRFRFFHFVFRFFGFLIPIWILILISFAF